MRPLFHYRSGGLIRGELLYKQTMKIEVLNNPWTNKQTMKIEVLNNPWTNKQGLFIKPRTYYLKLKKGLIDFVCQ
jgi:hypothetical protein